MTQTQKKKVKTLSIISINSSQNTFACLLCLVFAHQSPKFFLQMCVLLLCIAHQSQKLVNLCLVDDLLLFCNATPRVVQCVMDAFQNISVFSGLTTNKGNNAFIYSMKEQIVRLTSFILGSFPMKYLGLLWLQENGTILSVTLWLIKLLTGFIVGHQSSRHMLVRGCSLSRQYNHYIIIELPCFFDLLASLNWLIKSVERSCEVPNPQGNHWLWWDSRKYAQHNGQEGKV